MTKIFAMLPARALGDFTAYALLASSIADLFDDAELYVCYRVDRPYKDVITSYIRNAKSLIRIPGDMPGSIPIEFFDVHAGRMHLDSPLLEDLKLSESDIVLTGKMLNEAMLNSIPITTLRPPPETVTAGDDALMSLGLDPARWVATVYWKEGGYGYRGENSIRTIYDPTPYIDTIRYMTETLGGQVVRLGHPTSVQIPQFRGFIDLAKIANSEWLQLYAVSISRFFIGSGSGPIAYGSALGVPTAVVDQNICYGAWRSHDYILTQNIAHDGKILSQNEAYDAGILFTDWSPSHAAGYIRNTPAQLIAAANEMFRSTSNCIGWRNVLDDQSKSPRPNSLTLPIARRYRPELLIPPSLRSRTSVRRMYEKWVVVP